MNVRSHNHGFSLVEIMISLGILAIVAAVFASLQHNSQKLDVALNAKSQATSRLDQFVSMVLNDMKYVSNFSASYCTAPVCTSLAVDRNNTHGQSFHVNYINRCVPIPSTLAPQIHSQFADPGLAGRCFQALACPAGSYPRIEVTPSSVPPGTTLANYPRALPDLAAVSARHQGLSGQIVGAALCLTYNATDKITKMVVDVAVLSADGMLESVSRENHLLGGTNARGVIVLPTR